jgi:hypothetical protein
MATMLNRLSILAIVLSFGIYLSPRAEAQNYPQNSTQKSPDNCLPCAIYSTANNGTTDKAQSPQDKSPKWYKSPEWMLVVVGVITFFVMGRQSIHIKRSAEATRDSVKLQELAYSQWVAIANWRVDFVEDVRQLRIRVDITNQTSFPLTITSIDLTIGDTPRERRYFRDYEVFVSPGTPYMVEVSLDSADDVITAFKTAPFGTGVPVNGSIKHRGVLKKETTQEVCGLLVCGLNIDPRFESVIRVDSGKL